MLIGIIGFQPYMCPPNEGFPSRHTKLSYFFGWLGDYVGELSIKMKKACLASKTISS